MTEYVYLIKAGDQYKIGKSNRPNERLRTFQTANPQRLVMITTIPSHDAYGLENKFHTKFRSKRLSGGEWFNLTKTDVAYIKFYGDTVATKQKGLKAELLRRNREYVRYEEEHHARMRAAETVHDHQWKTHLRSIEEAKPKPTQVSVPGTEKQFTYTVNPQVKRHYEKKPFYSEWRLGGITELITIGIVSLLIIAGLFIIGSFDTSADFSSISSGQYTLQQSIHSNKCGALAPGQKIHASQEYKESITIKVISSGCETTIPYSTFMEGF